jgi:hypothetical protein
MAHVYFHHLPVYKGYIKSLSVSVRPSATDLLAASPKWSVSCHFGSRFKLATGRSPCLNNQP